MKNIIWDINKKTDNIKFSNNNLSCEKERGNYEGVLATINKNKGKWYWEITIDKCEKNYYNTDMLIGVCESSQKLFGFNGCRGFTNVRLLYDFGSKASEGTYTSYGENFITGDIISVLLDLDNGNIEFWKNGKSQGIAFNDLKNKTWFPCVFAYNGFKWTANFGLSPFKYTIPNSFQSLEKIKKYLIKQNNNYYTMKSSFHLIGTPENNNEKEKFYKENGIDCISEIKLNVIKNELGNKFQIGRWEAK